MIKNLFLIVITSLFSFSCSDGTHYFYSPDKSKCFTIKTNNNTRYIIDGYHRSVPESNYVKLDLSQVDRGAGDQIVGCWNRGHFNWIIVMDNVTILKNTLDSSKFRFIDHFPVDSSDIPTLKDYIGKDCFSISLEYSTLNRVNGSIESN